ncbi:MAG: hypothetical protein A2452_12315 [Candidatus Firestonebacteria bacterium RIFOXYC2_FULL_39_67]|nr:MAG: hypothetical protein A2536_07845 [Candidatus Firestonebacteria bacterium RIFOXYD2_FULL_39_29]OGF55649.1 MAG: hypothetical protein A2452_12315 [Candidatus Firestonebacteria bacterium RIFOXYC2_FULL_39_67]
MVSGEYDLINTPKNGIDPDSILMLQAKSGDIHAYEALVNKYKKPLLNFIYRFLKDRQLAEDIAQETFFRVYRARETYRPGSKFSTWLYTIASNLSLDTKKKEKRDASGHVQSMPDSGRELGSSDTPVYSGAENSRLEENIHAALQNLPETQRIALLLKVYEDKSYTEIAEIIGTTKPAVESLIFRARQNLKIKQLK